MEKNNAVFDFVIKSGDYIVSDQNNDFVHIGNNLFFSDKGLERLKKILSGIALDSQKDRIEFIDPETKRYYSISSFTYPVDGTTYHFHDIVDISEQINVFRTVSEMTSEWEEISAFQSAMLHKLNGSYNDFLPDIAKFFHTDDAILYLKNENSSKIVSYSCKNDNTKRTDIDDNDIIFSVKKGECIGDYVCFLKNTVGQQQYVIALHKCIGFAEDNLNDLAREKVTRLYIENGLMYDQIIWNNEHDQLTRLYNKGKYMDLLKNKFGSPKTITIYNMDLNNLKKMNDVYGHSAGDKMIVKAAESLHMVSSNNVHGFRMGGDEFMLIAYGLTYSESEELLERWHKAVDVLNEKDDGYKITIACGMTHGEGDYDLDELLSDADKLMYEDKKRLKGADQIR